MDENKNTIAKEVMDRMAMEEAKPVDSQDVQEEAKPEAPEETKPDAGKESEGPKVSNPLIAFNKEVMRLALDLIEKCQASDKTNNLAVFLAISCPGAMEKDEEGREVSAMGFTCGKMMNVAELVNGILGKHKDLLKAMRFDAEMTKIMGAFKLDSGKDEIKEVMSATDNEGFKRVLDVIRAVVGNKF